MTEIKNKIILKKICQMLSSGELTKVNLKRNLEKNSAISGPDTESAITYGSKQNVLQVARHNYVSLKVDMPEILEADYYACIENMLTTHYGSKLTPDGRFLVAKTARKDTKVAGRWTRPDFTVISNRKFPYIRDPEFDIITFEVKRPQDCEALAVFEALAHNSAATKSYVFFPVTETDLHENKQGERIREECVRHGIGLFLVNDGLALDEARMIIDAQRRPLNPEKCSHFLQNVLEPGELSKLTTWP